MMIFKKIFTLVVLFIFLFVETVRGVEIVCHIPQGVLRSTPQYNPNSGFCETLPIDEYNNCPEGYTYSQTLRTCIILPRCTGVYFYNIQTKACEPIEISSPPQGGGSSTQYDNVCMIDLNNDEEINENEIFQCIKTDNGSYLCPYDKTPCQPKYTIPDCHKGYTYDNGAKTCFAGPICEGGYYDNNLKSCRASPYCKGGGSLYNDNGTWICVASASLVCTDSGNSTGNSTCEKECPSGYSYSFTLEACTSSVSCSSGYFDDSLGSCIWAPPSCPAGGTFKAEIDKCESAPFCPSGSILTSNGCFIDNFCPYGNFPCKPVGGIMMCSAYECLTSQEIQRPDPEIPTDFEDDASINPDEQCLGQIYIFNGKKSKCRTKGVQTGFNDCCDRKLAKNKIYDSTGSTGMTFSLLKFGVDVIRHAYNMVYLGYLFASKDTYVYFGSMGVIISKSADFANPVVFDIGSKQYKAIGNMLNQMGIRPNTELIYTVPGGDQAVANVMAGYAQAIGPAMALAITHLAISGLIKDPQLAAIINLAADGVAYYLSITMHIAIISPVGLALAVITAIASFFMGGDCDKEDVITVTKRESGRCHYVGTRCIKRLKLGPIKKCIQKAKYYCCFNSKLARIIHEQGRPQLNTDIKNWGSGSHPHCRGFTPEEFASLDFDKMDLSEYFEDITRNISKNDEIQNRVEQYFHESVGKRTSN